jgi:hypothetical protein
MRKLPLILLATVLVLGLSAPVGAAVSFFEAYNQAPFSGGESIIDFNNIPRGEEITPQQVDGFVVTFSAGLYGEDFISLYFLAGTVGASNMNLNDTTQIPEPVITVNFPERFTRVGFDALNYGGTIMTVTVYRDGSEVDTKEFDRSSASFIGVEDPEGIDAIEMSGNGSFNSLSGVIIFDNLRFEGVVEDAEPEIIPAKVDIKPGNCMNPLNIRSRGVLRVAIHTDENLDATQVDPTTVLLMGVAPLDHDLGYVSDCSSDQPDEDDLDLILKFDTVKIVKAIGEVNDGTVLTLQLTGQLYDGKEIAGEDAVAILGKPAKKKHWKKRWKKHSKEHWKKHPKEHSKKHWKEKLKEKWEAFKKKWKSKRDK